MAEVYLFTLLTWRCSGCGLFVQGSVDQVDRAIVDHIDSTSPRHWSKAALDAGGRVMAGGFGYTTWITGPFAPADTRPPLIRS